MKRKNQKKKPKENLLVLTTLITSILLLSTTLADPTGPSGITHISNETKAGTPAQIVNISGGYISKFNITATVQNPHWKAFVGNIDGKFTLDDASGSTIYDWSLSSVGGEVYATRTSTPITWTGIGCANAAEIITESTALSHTGDDRINQTFQASSNTGTFVVAGTTISAGTCSATNTYDNNGAQNTHFEEVILASSSSEIIYATILEEDETGYDGDTYDFQMLVPEVALETWTGSTAYYLYVELS